MEKMPKLRKKEITLTLLIQRTINEIERDTVIARLEKQGWSVNVEDESNVCCGDSDCQTCGGDE